MDQIKMKNISSATVTIILPMINYRRILKPGREIPLTRAQYDEFMAEAGATKLIDKHFIQITGKVDNMPIETEDNVFSAVDIAKMFDTKDYTGFAKFIPTAATAEKDSIVQLAVEKKVTDNAFVALIKQYCGIDIINAISIQNQADAK